MNKCDCGAMKANTSHAHWCSSNQPDIAPEFVPTLPTGVLDPWGVYPGDTSQSVTSPPQKTWAEELKLIEEEIDKWTKANSSSTKIQRIIAEYTIYNKQGIYKTKCLVSELFFEELMSEIGATIVTSPTCTYVYGIEVIKSAACYPKDKIHWL